MTFVRVRFACCGGLINIFTHVHENYFLHPLLKIEMVMILVYLYCASC